jgi:hypothetical protein
LAAARTGEHDAPSQRRGGYRFWERRQKVQFARQIVVIFVLTVLAAPSTLFAQEEKKQDVWEPLRFFIGKWEGTGKGRPGVSTVEREYKFVLHDRFIEAKNKSVYEPQEDNPKGEVHEDWGLFSYDQGRKRFVLRQFHVEGFVNKYVLDSLSEDGKTLVYVTESIENFSPGWRAREIYKILSDDEFTETFELAAPDLHFEMYIENHFTRDK